MSEQMKTLIDDYEKHRNKISEHTAVGDETPEAKRARFNLMQKNYANWFDAYFPSFKKQHER